MDLDMSLVRAFVVTAEELHFGRAAERLYLSQQALSKRVQKLESEFQTLLFDRSTRTVALTGAGRRLLGPAREALAAADAAVAAVQHVQHILRADIMHERLAPARMMRELVEGDPQLSVELSSRRSLSMALPALLRGEVDVTFGRIHRPLPKGLAHRVIRLEPLQLLVDAAHPLTELAVVRPADLASYGMWTPAPGSASEWRGYVRDFADSVGAELSFPAVDIVTVEEILDRSEKDGSAFLTAADVQNPEDPRLRLLDLVDPVPLYPWSLIWRSSEKHPAARHMVAALGELSDKEGWCAARTQACWLPDDLADDLAEGRG